MATLVKMNSSEMPSIMTIVENSDKSIITDASINVNVVELTDGTYEWDQLVLPKFAVNNIHNADDTTKYNVLISHIIKAYYDDNMMTAVLNNYLLDPNDSAHLKEFNAMQKVRRLAKDTAKKIVEDNIF